MIGFHDLFVLEFATMYFFSFRKKQFGPLSPNVQVWIDDDEVSSLRTPEEDPCGRFAYDSARENGVPGTLLSPKRRYLRKSVICGIPDITALR